MKRSIFIITILALAAAPLLAAKELRCAAVAVETEQSPKAPPIFSATAVLDVTALVQFKHDQAKELSEGDHLLEVRFIGPQGFLYESRVLPITADLTKAGSARPVEGFRRPVKRGLVAKSKSGKELEVRVALPVGGTSIVSNALYGTWNVEAYVDGAVAPCADSARFEITE